MAVDAPAHRMVFELTFPSERHAEIVYRTCSVDAEIRPDRIQRQMTLEGNIIHLSVSGSEIRFVRVGSSSILENMRLASETLEAFSA